MDFVVVGIVIGSLIVGCGVIIADLGPRMKPWLTRSDQATIEPIRLKQSWSRYCTASGSLVSTGGLLMVLITVLGVVFDVSDSNGMRAVLVTGLIALVGVLLAALVIPRHYLSGGFDARIRKVESSVAPPATIVHDVNVPMSEWSADPDDIFVSVPVKLEDDEPAQPENTVAAPGSADAARETIVQLPDANSDEQDEAHHVTSDSFASEEATPEPEEARTSANFARPDIPVDGGEVEPGDAFEPWIAAPQGSVSPPRAANERKAMTQQQIAPISHPDAPLLPLDEELPAWNAPSPMIEPAVAPETPKSTRPETGHQQLAAGFESSLFADLEVPREEPVEEEGKFKSRLLNELTGDDVEQIEPVTDVLLDEFSLPQPGEPGTRGVGNG